MLLLTLFLVIVLCIVVYLFLIWNYDYWKRRGVNGPRPKLVIGNFPSVFTMKRSVAYDVDDIYRLYKKEEDFVGVFSCRTPQLLIVDPQMARRVYVSDFKHFHDNAVVDMVSEESDFLFANNPFSLRGEKWKERRAQLTPGLTANRIKTMYAVTTKVCKKLGEYIRRNNRVKPKDGFDAKDLSLRYTSEVVTDCVLGLNADSFTENPTPILEMIKKLFKPSFMVSFYVVLTTIFPSIQSFYKVRFIRKPIEKFFVDLMQKAMNIRRLQPQQQDRIDFLNYMLQLQEKKNISTMQLTAHTMTFLLDGFETTASVLSHCLLLLGRYPEIQQKLRTEVTAHLDENGEIDFEKLNELPYLDACIHETIRIFPPTFMTSKICTEPIELSDKKGNTLWVEKNMPIMIPLYSLMFDEDYYTNTQEFQPERFLEENGGLKKYREQGVYFGFGDGPRICIGMRFALTQIKAALVQILKDFNVHLNQKTRADNMLDPIHFLSQLEGGVWVDFSERD